MQLWIPLTLFSSDDKPESLSGDFKIDVGVFAKTIKIVNTTLNRKYNKDTLAKHLLDDSKQIHFQCQKCLHFLECSKSKIKFTINVCNLHKIKPMNTPHPFQLASFW